MSAAEQLSTGLRFTSAHPDSPRLQVKEIDNEVFIEGYASTDTIDRGREKMYIEGIDVSEYLKNPILLYYHKKHYAVGKIVKLEKRPEGLWVKAKISKSKTEKVTYVRDLVREGILQCFSIGFKGIDTEPDYRGVEHIRTSILWEISIVAIPMNGEAMFDLSQKDFDFDNLSYKDLKAMILREKGAKLAGFINSKMNELQEKDAGWKKDAWMDEVCKGAGCAPDTLKDLLAGNSGEVDTKMLDAIAKGLGVERAELDNNADAADDEMNTKEIGDTHDVSEEGTGGGMAVNEPVEGLDFVSASDNLPAEDATAEAIETKSLDEEDQQDSENAGSAEETPVEEEKEVVEEEESTEEEGDAGQPDNVDPAVVEENQTSSLTPDETVAARFIDEAEMVEQGDANALPSWVGNPDLWQAARKSAISLWGEPSFPFVIYFYFTQGGNLAGKEASKKEANEQPKDVELKTKDFNPGSGQAMAVQNNETMNADPHLLEARQTNVMLGTAITLLQNMTQKLDAVCNPPLPPTLPGDMSVKELDELENLQRKIEELSQTMKALS